jgi:hypothetical protein
MALDTDPTHPAIYSQPTCPSRNIHPHTNSQMLTPKLPHKRTHAHIHKHTCTRPHIYQHKRCNNHYCLHMHTQNAHPHNAHPHNSHQFRPDIDTVGSKYWCCLLCVLVPSAVVNTGSECVAFGSSSVYNRHRTANHPRKMYPNGVNVNACFLTQTSRTRRHVRCKI